MFGNVLKNLMIDGNITQQQLADNIGYAQRTISSWIRNQSEPTETAIKKCAEFFDVSTDYLLGLDDFGIRPATPITFASAPMSESLTAEERKVLEQYRSLPEQLRKLIRQQLDVFTAPEELLSKTDKKV